MQEGNNNSERPAISADGRHVAFESLASKLVTDAWCPQDRHSHSRRLGCSPASAPPQRGHENPSGQRDANRYPRHASSSGNRRWNSTMVRGKSGRGTPRPYETARTERTGYAGGPLSGSADYLESGA